MGNNSTLAARRQKNTRNTSTYKPARILWPALGFPEVIPAAGGGGAGGGEIVVLFLCEVPPGEMNAGIVARHLRYVPWSDRHCRYQEPHPGNSFPESRIEVNEVPVVASDALNAQIHFGRGAVQAGLARTVLAFYNAVGLKYLYEARIAPAPSPPAPVAPGGGLGQPAPVPDVSQIGPGLYQLLWINRNRSDTPRDISDEMRVLIEHHAKKVRFGNDGVPQYKYLEKSGAAQPYLDEYEFDYNRSNASSGPERTEVLHPLFVLPPGHKPHLNVGHLTDMHVDLRIERLKEMLAPDAQRRYNNFNDNFAELYADARTRCDALLLTGDLIDYGRGYYGRVTREVDASFNTLSRRHNFGSDKSYWRDRNWFLFYSLLASGEQTYSKPAYTILGNHDWRLHPYHSLASDGPSPSDYGLTKKELEDAHGETEGGHGLHIMYGPDTFDSLPTFTAIESVKWYLLLINPFLEYLFDFPGGYPVLMLDWEKNERVIIRREDHPDPEKIGKNVREDVLKSMGQTVAPSPIARDALSPVQKSLVDWFVRRSGPGKILGIHAPLVGPYTFWKDEEMLDRDHAIEADFADHGSIGKHRDHLLTRVIQGRVKLVATGHIHRTNVFVLYETQAHPKALAKAIDPADARLHDWPLLLNTTSMGPPGRYNDKSAAPAYAHVRMSSTGKIEQIAYRSKGAPGQPIASPTTAQKPSPAGAGTPMR